MTSPISASLPSPQGSPSDAPPATRPAPPLLDVARAFLLIGSLAFGGQGGLLALLSRDLVERRKWVEEAEITEAFTYVQLLPGAVVVQVAAYLGFRLRGWRGAATAAACFLLPSVTAMLLLAAMYRRVASIAGVSATLNGLTAAVVGLIALAAYKQARKTIKNAMGILLAVGICAASAKWHVNPAILVVGAGLIGVVREALTKDSAVPTEAASPKEPGKEAGQTDSADSKSREAAR